MKPQNQRKAHNGPQHIAFDLAHFPDVLERAERALKENRRLIDENDIVSIAHLQSATDALFNLLSHAETLYVSSKDLYAKLREVEGKRKAGRMQQKLKKERKRTKNLENKVRKQRETIHDLQHRLDFLEVPLETTDRLWMPFKRDRANRNNLHTDAWSSVSTPSSPTSEHTSTWEVNKNEWEKDNSEWKPRVAGSSVATWEDDSGRDVNKNEWEMDKSEWKPWVLEGSVATWEDDSGRETWEVENIHQKWGLPEDTWEGETPESTCNAGQVTEHGHICYTMQKGVEVADVHGKCDSAFVATVQMYRDCIIRRPAFAHVMDEHAVLPCKLQPYKPFKPDGECDVTEVTYFGFHYPDGTALPYLPVQNVKLLYHDGMLEREQRPSAVCDGHTGIEVGMSEQVLHQIECSATEVLRESMLSGIDKDSEEYYRLVTEGCARVQGPEVEYIRKGRAHLVVGVNPQCYVRQTVDGYNRSLGLLESIMMDRQADLEADVTFFVRAVKRKDTNGVPNIGLKLNSVFVDGDEFKLP